MPKFLKFRNESHTAYSWFTRNKKKKLVSTQTCTYCVQILFIYKLFIMLYFATDIFHELAQVNDQLMFVFVTESMLHDYMVYFGIC